jgi:uncharacterized protein YndB with AHSA1/START domain
MSSNATVTLPPVRRSIRVAWAPDSAFRRFTAEIASWWPLRTHSVGQEKAQTVIFEGRAGGRIFERIEGGEESTWGTVISWDPPRRVAFTWHPGLTPETAGEVELKFLPDGAGTRLELTHTGWEKLGPIAAKARKGYNIGWVYVLKHYAGQTSNLFVWTMDAMTVALRPLQKRAAAKMQAKLDAFTAQAREAGPSSPAR